MRRDVSSGSSGVHSKLPSPVCPAVGRAGEPETPEPAVGVDFHVCRVSEPSRRHEMIRARAFDFALGVGVCKVWEDGGEVDGYGAPVGCRVGLGCGEGDVQERWAKALDSGIVLTTR